MIAGRDGVALGAALILGGMAVLGITDNLVRLISDEAGCGSSTCCAARWRCRCWRWRRRALGIGAAPRRPGAVAVRSGVQTGAMLLYFGALPMMPIAQVGAALFTAPIWVLLFGAALFGRRIGPRQALAVALGFAGVLAMLRPDPANLSAVTLMPIAAGALYGLSNLLTREWCAEEPLGALLAGFFGGLGARRRRRRWSCSRGSTCRRPGATAAPFLTAPWRAPSTGTLLFWVFVQAAGSLVAVGMIARGYQTGETGSLAVFEYSFLLTARFWAWFLWGEALAPVDFLGIAMIVASGAIIASARPPASAVGAAVD